MDDTIRWLAVFIIFAGIIGQVSTSDWENKRQGIAILLQIIGLLMCVLIWSFA